MAAGRTLAAVLAATIAGSCSTSVGPDDPADSLPPRPVERREGPRLPEFSGGDPAVRGWVKRDGLLWVDPGQPAPERRTLPPGTPAEEGFLLRTDHVSLRTDLPWESGRAVASLAEAHVREFVQEYGDALDLRLPNAPLTVVAFARRVDFERRLRGAVDDEVSWGAFYDARSGAVFVCREPAPRGALPLEADLRHEMTHQVLDLSSPVQDRRSMFRGAGFWLWEAIAVHAEGEAGRARRDRFRRRLAWGEWTPLERLFALGQDEFQGIHYDQAASLIRFLLGENGPAWRAAVLEATRAMLHEGANPDVPARLGLAARDLEARWLAWARTG
jgi:hypothetical protein